MTASTTTVRTGWRQYAVAAIGIMFLPAGLQAALAPRSFYDSFPFGRSWIVTTGGPYNEHLVRDVGSLFLALVLVSLWALRRPTLVEPVAAAWLVMGGVHLVFHAGHLDHLESIDKVLMIGSLVLPLALAAAVIGAAFSARSPRE